MQGEVDNVVESAGSVVAVGRNVVYFIDKNSHLLKREDPVQPEGALEFLTPETAPTGAVALMAAPAAQGLMTFRPAQALVVSQPVKGRSWSVQFGDGVSTASNVWITFDDAAQPWLRVGDRLAKPLPAQTYCRWVDPPSTCL